MSRFFSVLFFLLIHSSLFSSSSETPEENSHLIDLQGMPTSTIAGCVNAITGNYSESHVDLIVPSSNLLPLIRSYNSSKHGESSLQYGWDLNHTGGVKFVFGERERHAIVDYAGSNYHFEGGLYKETIYLNDETFKYGVTNAHDGQLTARQNLENTKFTYEKYHKHCQLRLNNNEAVEFKAEGKITEDVIDFRLTQHHFPNECRFNYSYSSDKIQTVRSLGYTNQNLGFLHFIYPKSFKNNPDLTIESSCGRFVQYIFRWMSDGKYFLSEVNSSHLPQQTYNYYYDKLSKQHRLIKRSLPDGRYLNISYYEKGNFNLNNCNFIINGKKDSRYGRVSYLTEPTGTDTTPITTHSFIYNLKKDKISSKPIGGYTDVYDAYGNKNSYHFTNKHRLERVDNFLKNGQLYRQEKIVWSTSGKGCSLLRKRSILDANQQLILERIYEYDKYGNSTIELLTGNLTGLGSLETYSKSFKYTAADKVACENDGRKEILYRYILGTDLISAKYIVDGEQKKQRVFFTYDSNAALTSESIDDGDQIEYESYSAITERRIKRIQPNDTAPYGLPKVIDELGLDLQTKKEVLLRRTVNTYSPEGYILDQSVHDCHGNLAYQKSWTYNSMGKITSEVDPLGQVTLYDYDANGNCILKKVENTEFYTSLIYDYSNRLIREEEVYNDGLRLVKCYSYDYRGNKISSSDIYGNLTKYEYDEFNRIIEIKHPPIVDVEGNQVHPCEKMTYDVLNNITSKTDGNGNTTHLLCNAFGKPYIIEYPDGSVERSEYNIDGTLKKLISPNGSYTLYEYDYQKRKTIERNYSPNGTLLSFETQRYNAFHLISTTDKLGRVTNLSYDVFGRLISCKTEGLETRFVYDSLGRQTEVWESVSDGYFKKSICVYDLLDRVIEERTEDTLGILLSKKTYAYDSAGNKTHETIVCSQNETSKITEFNGQNQPVKIIHPNGEISYMAHSFDYYDESGHAVPYHDTVDPKGNRIVYIYNTQGKQAAEVYYSPAGTILKKLSYHYDRSGNLIRRVEDIIEEGRIVDSVVTSLEYDTRNREIATIKAYGRPEQKIFRKEYTYFDKISRQIKPDGIVIDYTYDSLGRLIEVFDSGNTIHYEYSYDANDNVISVFDKIDGTTTNRLFNKNDFLTYEIQNNGLILKYKYDQLGRIEKAILPDNTQISYTYDALNLSSITRINKSEVYRQIYSYDLSGRPSNIKLPNENGTITYEYDSALRLKNVKSTYFKQEIPEDGYDENNNITKSNQIDPVSAISSNYTYDSLNQLISEDGISTHTYEYDSRQNRSKKDEIEYEVDILSQLVTQADTSYRYDPNGNRDNVSSSIKSLNCKYDALDRLIEITNGSLKVRYSYDAFNRRMSKSLFSSVNGKLELSSKINYIYVGDTEIGSVSSDGVIRELMICAGSNPALMELNGNIYLPIQDHRGNVVTLIDAKSRSVVETYRYSSFGEECILDPRGVEIQNGLSPWRFSGKRVDPETGWVFFGRRYYDPEVGRWTTSDPLWFEDGPNLYAYVQNNPIIFVDPNGLKHHGVENDNKHTTFSHYEKIASICRWFIGPLGWFSNVKDSCSETIKTGDEANSKLAILFINGIFNSKNDTRQSIEMISGMAGGCEVRGLYNCSYGVLDLFEAFMGLMRIDTDPVAKLHQLWDEEFARLGKDGKILQICHSQGCIHVRNALETYDKEKRNNVLVIAVCPAAYISKDICGGVMHLVNDSDIVTYIDRNGRIVSEDTIMHLVSNARLALLDHGFDSATFNLALSDQIKDIINQFGVISEKK